MSHEPFRELCAAHALSALDPFESVRLEAHLRDSCELCEAEIAAHRATVEAMGGLVEQEPPPAEVESRLMALVAGEEPGEGSQRATRFLVASTGGGFTRWLLPAAAVVIAGFALFVGVQSRQDAARSAQQASRLADENASLHQMIHRISGPDVQVFELGATAQSPGSQAWAYRDPKNPEDPTDDHWSIHAQQLQPPPVLYHAWLRTAERTVPLGVLQTDADGNGYLDKDLSDAVGEFTIQVTMESERIVESPTGPVILQQELPKLGKPPRLIFPKRMTPIEPQR